MGYAITGPYVAALALVMILLQIRVIIARTRTKVMFGDGGDMALLLAIRRHGNFIETVPMAVILMALAEGQGLSGAWLHAAGLILLVSRLVHPFGLAASGRVLPIRIAGTVGTWVAMLIPACALLLPLIGG